MTIYLCTEWTIEFKCDHGLGAHDVKWCPVTSISGHVQENAISGAITSRGTVAVAATVLWCVCFLVLIDFEKLNLKFYIWHCGKITEIEIKYLWLQIKSKQGCRTPPFFNIKNQVEKF